MSGPLEKGKAATGYDKDSPAQEASLLQYSRDDSTSHNIGLLGTVIEGEPEEDILTPDEAWGKKNILSLGKFCRNDI